MNNKEWTVIKEKQIRCKVKFVTIGKDKIIVMLLFPNGKTGISHIETQGFVENLTWIDKTAEESYADVSVQMLEKINENKIYYEPNTRTPNGSSCVGIVYHKKECLKKIVNKDKEYKINIKINNLYLKENAL